MVNVVKLAKPRITQEMASEHAREGLSSLMCLR